MRAPESRPKPIDINSRQLLARDLLTPASPYTPVTPSSSTAFGILNREVRLSAPPTPTSSSFGIGVLVRLSDGTLAVRTIRKTLRIETTSKDKDNAKDDKEKYQELVEGEEVDFRTDGCKAFDVKRRAN